MAVIKNGFNGTFSGKIGSIVGYELNGRNIIRVLPRQRTKKPSEKELANRHKFALSQWWLQPLLHFVRIGFKHYAPTFQGFVAAKSYNSKHALKQQEDGTWFVDPASVLVSYGHLPLPRTINMERSGDELLVTWSNEDSERRRDNVMLLGHTPDIPAAFGETAISSRENGRAILTIPENVLGKEIYIYIAFIAYDQSAQSNSHYLGTVLV